MHRCTAPHTHPCTCITAPRPLSRPGSHWVTLRFGICLLDTAETDGGALALASGAEAAAALGRACGTSRRKRCWRSPDARGSKHRTGDAEAAAWVASAQAGSEEAGPAKRESDIDELEAREARSVSAAVVRPPMPVSIRIPDSIPKSNLAYQGHRLNASSVPVWDEQKSGTARRPCDASLQLACDRLAGAQLLPAPAASPRGAQAEPSQQGQAKRVFKQRCVRAQRAHVRLVLTRLQAAPRAP